MRVRILVSFKDSVLDPQGQTVKNALHTMGYDAVKDVRQGKVFEVELDRVTKKDAEALVAEIATMATRSAVGRANHTPASAIEANMTV